MKPLSLKLRGNIGIHAGLGLDEIEIDFTKYSPGLVAIIGTNGSGKSSTIGNLTPYRTQAGKDGSLANQFSLKDSYRDFRFSMAGHQYRSYIVIDGRTSKQEAYLYCDGKPMNDGKTTTYDIEIEKLLGTEEIFFRSVFATQKAKSITSLTAGKRKELFMELLGFLRYEQYAQHCKIQGDEIETQVATGRGRLEQINLSLAKRPVVTKELEEINQNLIDISSEMRDVQAQIDSGTAALAEQDHQLAEDKQKGVQVHDLGNEMMVIEGKKWKLNKDFETEAQKLKTQKETIEQEISRKQQIVGHKHDIEENVIRLQMLRLELKGINERREQVLVIEREQEKAREQYHAELSAYRLTAAACANERSALENEKKHLLIDFEISAQNAEERLERARKSAGLIDEVPCKTYSGLPETCQLLTTAIAARNTIAELEENVRASRDPALRQERGLADLEARVKATEDRTKGLTEPTNHVDNQFTARIAAIGFDPARHLTAGKEILALEAKKWESLLEELRLAEAAIEDRQKSLGELAARVIELSDKHHIEDFNLGLEMTEKRAKWEGIKSSMLPADFYTKHDDLKTVLTGVQNELKILTDKRSGIMGDIQFRQELIKQLDQSAIEAEAIEKEIKGRLSSLENWRLLQRACSKDGIPALELDAAGPAVSQIANELLASTFGARFQIAFETTRQSKDGKKQIEDFDIWVYGDEGRKRIEDLSGGEGVWIEAAIRQAIASYMRTVGDRIIETRFLDECDGALDGENAQHYLDMVRASHAKDGCYFTFLISHRAELVSQIQQQIRFLPEEHRLEFVY